MIQTINRMTINCGFGGATLYYPVNGGVGSGQGWTPQDHIEYAIHPTSVDKVWTSLKVTLPVAQGNNVTLTFMAGADPSVIANTALTVTVPAGQTSGSIVTNVPTSAGDVVVMKFTGNSGPGFNVTFCLESNSNDNFTTCYGILPSGAGWSNNEGRYGGAFGNGLFSETISGGSPHAASASYSVNGASRIINRLDAVLTNSNVPGMGNSYEAFVMVDGVIQDGTGGTVDTKATIGATGAAAHSTFTLTVGLYSRVEYVAFYRGSGTGGGRIACSCATKANSAGEFLICGGNNNAYSLGSVYYLWNLNEQQNTTESLAAVPVGPSGLTLSGYHIEFTTSTPGAISTKVRKSGADTALAISAASAISGQVAANVSFVSTDTIDLVLDRSVSSPVSSNPHWVMTAVQPGSIVIIKDVIPSSSTGETFTVTVVADSTYVIIISGGQSYTITNVPVGSGYSAIETPRPNWMTTYNVSGSGTYNNFDVSSGYTTSITIMNTYLGPYSGIYYIKPAKTNDTLYSLITPTGTTTAPTISTTVVAIPNPHIIL